MSTWSADILQQRTRAVGTLLTVFENHPHARERLATDLIAWLTTVRPDGRPQTSPVWFLIDGNDLLVFSAKTARVHNLVSNPHVAVNLDGNGRGGDIVTLEGTARIVADEPPASSNVAYVAKYAQAMERNGWTPERFSALYPMAIRIRFDRGRAW
jgi:PPOX class probable F420-dependent enzyme